MSVVNSISDRINVLERKLEVCGVTVHILNVLNISISVYVLLQDVVKSTAMLDKMEGVTNATIDQLK